MWPLSVEHQTVGWTRPIPPLPTLTFGRAPEVTPVADAHDGPRGLATHDGLRLC
jgi:hypothetical protein